MFGFEMSFLKNFAGNSAEILLNIFKDSGKSRNQKNRTEGKRARNIGSLIHFDADLQLHTHFASLDTSHLLNIIEIFEIYRVHRILSLLCTIFFKVLHNTLLLKYNCQPRGIDSLSRWLMWKSIVAVAVYIKSMNYLSLMKPSFGHLRMNWSNFVSLVHFIQTKSM